VQFAKGKRGAMPNPGYRKGVARERAVRDWLADRDWIAFRAPASLGCADVIALRDGSRPRLIEVKSTAQGPYEHFPPAARARLRGAARLAGASAYLAWWPPRGSLIWIPESEFPEPRGLTAP
jgi:Holliday junction resolvase